MKVDISLLVCEEALDALLLRVSWYTKRGHDVPERLRLAFNFMCGVLNKPDALEWRRLAP